MDALVLDLAFFVSAEPKDDRLLVGLDVEEALQQEHDQQQHDDEREDAEARA